MGPYLKPVIRILHGSLTFDRYEKWANHYPVMVDEDQGLVFVKIFDHEENERILTEIRKRRNNG